MDDLTTDAQVRSLFGDFRQERGWTTFAAFVVAALLHLGMVVALPEHLLLQSRTTGQDEVDEPFTVEIALNEPLTPEQLKFVEASPEAPENEPDRKDQYSYRSQQAADEVPNEDLLDAPRVDGEELSQKILQGDLTQAPPLPPGVYSTEAQPGEGEGTEGGKAGQPESVVMAPPKPRPAPDFLQQEPLTEDGTGSNLELSGEAQELVEQPQPDAPLDLYQPQPVPNQPPTQVVGDGQGGQPDAKPVPRARPRLNPELIHGPLMSSTGSASRRGKIAIDATFSEFGEYQQQFYAAVQVGWYQEIDFFQPIDTSTRVVVRFTMHADGTIQEVEAVQSTASEVATVICESAISKRSPFRPWTKEMVEVFGETRTLHVAFHYR